MQQHQSGPIVSQGSPAIADLSTCPRGLGVHGQALRGQQHQKVAKLPIGDVPARVVPTHAPHHRPRALVGSVKSCQRRAATCPTCPKSCKLRERFTQSTTLSKTADA
eukprot:scaffold719_cov359-Prasinococcus_capsulatus_cf.AAC.16